MRQLTKTELEAYTRRKAFHLKIELQAAQVETPAAPAAVAPTPVKVAPEAMPAETDPPPVKVREIPDAIEPRTLTAREIQVVVARAFGVSLGDIKGSRREQNMAIPRHVAMTLVRELCPHKSLPMIGREFGGRDHTTILNAVHSLPGKIARSPDLAEIIERVRARLRDLAALPVRASVEPDDVICGNLRSRAYPSVDRIMGTVARFYHLTPREMLGTSRANHIRHARNVALYLASDLTRLSAHTIAYQFGGRHHSLTTSAVLSVPKLMRENIAICWEVAQLFTALEAEGE